MRTKLAAKCVARSDPRLGKEDFLKGQLDVVNKVAIIYNDNDVMGFDLSDRADPRPNHVELVNKAHDELVAAILRPRRRSRARPSSRKCRFTSGDAQGRHSAAQTIANRFVPRRRAARLSRNKGRGKALVDGRHRLSSLPSPIGHSARQGSGTRIPAEPIPAIADDNANFSCCGAGVQAWERSVSSASSYSFRRL